MTTSPVTALTDELIAELEPCASEDRSHNRAFRALVVERAELKRDAERYRWLRGNWFHLYGESRGLHGIKLSTGDTWNHVGLPSHVDAAIDAAMQEKQP